MKDQKRTFLPSGDRSSRDLVGMQVGYALLTVLAFAGAVVQWAANATEQPDKWWPYVGCLTLLALSVECALFFIGSRRMWKRASAPRVPTARVVRDQKHPFLP